MKKRPPPFTFLKGGGRFFQVQEILNLMTLVRSEGTFPPYRKWIFHILDNKSTTCFSPLSPVCSFAEMLLPLRDTVPHLRFLHIFAVLLIIPQYSHQGKQVPEAHNTIRDIMKGETCLSDRKSVV